MATEQVRIIETENAELKPGWYMIAVRPQYEQDAADGFRRERVRAYWPSYTSLVPMTIRRSGRLIRRNRLVAIIPGYIFTPEKSGIEDLIELVPNSIRVERTFSGNPLLLREDDIDVLRRIEKEQNTPKPGRGLHTFKVGQRVRFVDDLLGRWPPGKVGRLSKDGRISVDISLMGRVTAVIVLPHQIERS